MISPGDVIAEWDFLVEAGKLQEFARAVRHPEPMGPLAPPTFPVVASAALAERLVTDLLGLDRSRTVHGEQSYEFFAPIRAGNLLRCRARMVSDEDKDGRRLRVIKVGFEHRLAATGELVCREVMTAIEKQEKCQ